MKTQDTEIKGFALIATVSIMVLAILIALAMISLATVTSRTTGHSHHYEQARSNARLALTSALGTLQMELGPDKRVNANANIAGDVKHPYFVGVWDSLATDEDPIPTYDLQRESKFRKFLVSNQIEFNSLDSIDNDLIDPIELVGSGTVSDPLMHMSAGRLKVNDMGSMAWVISDSNSKASVNTLQSNDDSHFGIIRERYAASNSNTTSVDALKNAPLNEKHKVHSFLSMDLSDSTKATTYNNWHSLTHRAPSLLTNTADGGLKKDLSLLFELPRSEDSTAGLGGVNTQGNLYEEANQATTYLDLYDYYNLYREVEYVNDIPVLNSKVDAEFKNDKSKVYKMPLIAKFDIYISLAMDEAAYRPRVILDPVMTLWNPNNIAMNLNLTDMGETLDGKFWALPYSIQFTINGVDQLPIPLKALRVSNDDALGYFQFMNWLVTEDIVLGPGECKVFSHNSNTPTFIPSHAQYGTGGVTLTEGWLSSGGLMFQNNRGYFSEGKKYFDDGHVDADGSGRLGFKIKASSAHEAGGYYGSWFYGVEVGFSKINMFTYHYAIWNKNSEKKPNTATGVLQSDIAEKIGELYVDAGDSSPQYTYSQIRAIGKQPIAKFSISLRSELDSKFEGSSIFNCNPRSLRTYFDSLDESNMTSLPFELDLIAIDSFNSPDVTPINAENQGYIGGGNSVLYGQTNVTFGNIPTSPLLSLAGLQYATLGIDPEPNRFHTLSTHNPTVIKAIGNSYAQPTIGSDKFVDQHLLGNHVDHSYLANRSLWDSHFFSGCASTYENPYNVSPEPKTAHVRYQDFRLHEFGKPLLNQRYFFDEEKITMERLFDESGNVMPEAWMHIAANMAIDGGFNVNSTSVTAWTTLLGGLKGRKIGLNKIKTVDSTEIVAQEEADKSPFGSLELFNGDASNETEHGDYEAAVQEKEQWIGYRYLTDEDLQDLAKHIVDQVKLRGPFLSMSDFVNRRLSNDDDLASKGALQAAIDLTDINKNYKFPERNVDPALSGTYGYKFPKASEVPNACGIAGFVCQSDILMPFGSIMKVRSDTFVIRTYGESRDGNGVIMATAYLEATVTRSIDYVDHNNSPEDLVNMLTDTNKLYGRRFEVVQMKWLTKEEI